MPVSIELSRETLNWLKNKDRRHFHVMIKPSGPICNLGCTYCYYLEKENLFSDKKGLKSFSMSYDVLENYIKQYIGSQHTDNPKVVFAWQGGEASLLGIEFYEKAVEFQNKYSDGRLIENTFQTNGTLIDEQWAEFFVKNNFLIGISIDGPEHVHDKYRVTKGGRGTWERVMQTIVIFRSLKVEYNILATVNSESVKDPVGTYRFLKSLGSDWIQFLPVQDRIAVDKDIPLRLVDNKYTKKTNMTEESITPEEWGKFLVEIFDEWVKNDVGKIFVKQFDTALEGYMGYNPNACIHSKYCGDALALEHNGDVYSCDHFVYPEYKLGNIMKSGLKDLAASYKQEKFGKDKFNTLSKECLNCRYLTQCYGECPKHRFTVNKDNEKIAYLCKGFMMFYEHTDPFFKVMKELINRNIPASGIMNLLNENI